MRDEEMDDSLICQRDAINYYLHSLLQSNVSHADTVHIAPVIANPSITELPVDADQINSINEEKKLELLFFSVAGLGLACIKQDVADVIDCVSDILAVPDSPNWLMGLYPHEGAYVKVIDPYLLLVPEKRRKGKLDKKCHKIEKILLIGNGDWGVASETAMQVERMSSSSIKWNKEKNLGNNLLCGTIKSHHCAMINIKKILCVMAS